MLFSATITQLISDAREKANKILHDKYPELGIKDSEGFGGFAGNKF